MAKSAKKQKSAKRTKSKSPKKKKPMQKSAKAKLSASNRRNFRRYSTPKLWVVEYSGEYRFVSPVENLSEGGMFLKGRVLNSSESAPSRFIFRLTGSTLEIQAEAIHDRISEKTCGTGYRFVTPSQEQTKSLRSLLRNFN